LRSLFAISLILFICLSKSIFAQTTTTSRALNVTVSNVSVIGCAPDIQDLQTGRTWLSFPRLERDEYGNDDPEEVLSQDRISDGYEELVMTHLLREPATSLMTSISWVEGIGWQNNYLDVVRSERGYKLLLTPEQERTIELHGIIAHPETTIDIYAGDENWIGYFLEEPHTAQDAFAGVWDKLTMIQTQYWTMAKIQGYWFETEKVGPLQYGDAVIVKCTEDCSFQWAQDAAPGLPKEYTKTAFFTYEEEAEYTPIYVEFDTTDLPLEVGVFCDSVCYGAEIVTPNDTMVQINAYIDTTGQGEELEFVYYYGTKNVPVNKRDYWLFNPVTSRMEQKKIRKGENREWYWVSFKKNEEVFENPVKDLPLIELLSVQPNPVHDQVEISYCLHTSTSITIRVMTLYGQEVKILLQGKQAEGSYTIFWDGEKSTGQKAENGIYLLSVETPYEALSGKLIFMR